ncbi:MAG: hypothetical protein SFV81_10425, partial [Pirellulaceae bacterium]|nr:hypothetical protein [Pirellulaceae bacterium]
MIPSSQLHIRFTPGRAVVFQDFHALNRISGGPAQLLSWLETQLGLPQPDVHRAARVMQYADALDKVANACFAQSFASDRWETASDLLAKRDELLMSGWDGKSHEACPRLALDLAVAETGYAKSFPGEFERLTDVLVTLDAGQQLPEHQLFLADGIDSWPAVWQGVLRRMSLCRIESPVPKGANGPALYQAADLVRGFATPPFDCDASLRVANARSETAAIEFLASVCSKSPERLARTVVYCEDDALAVRLDVCLQRIGLPTMGASLQTRAHPVLQVLPLALELCWEPVDPQCLLDFLTLPIIPIPRAAASDLARALGEEPGLGSSSWETAFHELCDKSDQAQEDPGKLKQRLHDWFCDDRSPQGQSIATALVAKQCRKVSKWAIGRASLIWKDTDQESGELDSSDE